MPSPPPQPVPTANKGRTPSGNNLAAPSYPQRPGASPISYGGMAGISFTNGGGFSFEGKPRSAKWPIGNGGQPGSFGARFYGDGVDSPYQPFSTSITMGEPSSYISSSMAFGLPSASMSSSYQRRSYAAAVAGAHNLSSSFASMSFQPMSFGTSYSKSQVHNLMQTRSDAELTKQYECCGQHLDGLHALLEHVEDAHPMGEPDMDMGFSPVHGAMELEMDGLGADGLETTGTNATNGSNSSSQSPIPVPSYPLPPSAASSKPTTPTESLPKALKISDVLTSPPESDGLLSSRTAFTNSTTSSPPDSLTTPTTSAQPSPVFAAPKMNPARPGFMGSTAPRPAAQQKRFDRAFNEVVASASPDNKDAPTTPTAVAPGVLFANAVAGLGIPTTPPVPGQKPDATPKEGQTDNETTPQAGGNAAKLAEAQMPQPSLFTTHKPWRCPNPGCNKAYKQSNGLKYHQQKGQCDFAIHDAVDLGLSLEEAEERSRPFVCAVGAGCNKRYRQMNGLKYHYLNSGEHGQYGLRMLQNGTHPHPPSLPQPQKRTTPVTTPTPVMPPTSTVQRAAAAAPYNVPSKMPNGVPRPNQAGPRMGTWPAKPLPPKQAPPVQLPIQKGKDAVLFAAVGNDPLDVNGRMEI